MLRVRHVLYVEQIISAILTDNIEPMVNIRVSAPETLDASVDSPHVAAAIAAAFLETQRECTVYCEIPSVVVIATRTDAGEYLVYTELGDES